MKLKSILGAFSVIATIAFATSVYAADETVDLGTPIDLATGEEVESYTAGQKILVPIDIYNSAGNLKSYTLFIQYDTNNLTAGINGDDVTEDELNVLANYLDSSMSNLVPDINYETYYGAINNISYKRLTATVYAGTANTNINQVKNGVPVLGMTWYESTERSIKTDEPEAYALFTVNNDVDSLNFELMKQFDSESSISAADNVSTGFSSTITKANACLTAFKVSVDNDAIPAGTWIQKLYAKVGDTTQDLLICNNDGTSSIYEFPARVLTNSTGSDTLAIEIYAVTSSDEAGAESTGDVLIGTVNATADSTATDYSAGTFTANAGYAN